MKIKLKRLVSVCIVVIMAVVFTGCGNSSEPPAAENADQGAAEAPSAEDAQANEEAESKEAESDEANAEAEEEASAGTMRLVGGEDILEGTKNVRDEKSENGSYFTQDMSEDGMLIVYQQGGIDLPGEDVTEEEYAQNLVAGLPETGANDDLKLKPGNEYSKNLSYPVYVASFTSGSNEDTMSWWVFTTFTDSGVYLFGISTPVDAEPDAGALADEVFPKLRLG